MKPECRNCKKSGKYSQHGKRLACLTATLAICSMAFAPSAFAEDASTNTTLNENASNSALCQNIQGILANKACNDLATLNNNVKQDLENRNNSVTGSHNTSLTPKGEKGGKETGDLNHTHTFEWDSKRKGEGSGTNSSTNSGSTNTGFNDPFFQNTKENATPESTPKVSHGAQITITYNPNGANVKGMVTRTVITNGHGVIAPERVTRNGYIFLNWNTQPDGSGKSFLPGEVAVGLQKDTQLYAQWKKVDPNDSFLSGLPTQNTPAQPMRKLNKTSAHTATGLPTAISADGNKNTNDSDSADNSAQTAKDSNSAKKTPLADTGTRTLVLIAAAVLALWTGASLLYNKNHPDPESEE